MNTPEKNEIKNLTKNVLNYLKTYPEAADNIEGISQWWLSNENQAANLDTLQAALDFLVQRGEVEKMNSRDSNVVYRRPRDRKKQFSSSVKNHLKRVSPGKRKARLSPETSKQLRFLVREFKQGRGHIAIFTGGAGTGKTMAAELLGREHGMQIYSVDLAAVISKYIGETEKNLSELFDSVRSQDVVLIFDEAESLFGKKTRVKASGNRYANLDTDSLWRRIDSHPGLVILTTNQPDQIDDAFWSHTSWSIEPGLPGSANPIELKQAGEPFSGQYYVHEVKHDFGENQYQESFDVKRGDANDE